ncbi:hypothetical protein [Streptomyces sp. NPDC058621]|uniref:hypothetical protein n=1 Tax=Streptomyces sp. NPDC058621 TaxID=3346561 RepID=UPI00364AE2E6
MLTLLLAVAAAVGYLTGRTRPARRVSDWAHWQTRPTGLRLAAVWTIRTAEDLSWIATHPRQAWRSWRTRNDPPAWVPVPVRADPWPPEGPR